ncbi:MAG TPA: serpin family protein [bacterium]|nr:serpin family protein [bacterium]
MLYHLLKKLGIFLIIIVLSFSSIFALSLSKRGTPQINELEKSDIEHHNWNNFAFNIFHSIDSSHYKENICISPLSISMTLGMVLNGAQKTTSQQIEDVLSIGTEQKNVYNNQVKHYIDSLRNKDKEVQLQIGNSIWIKESFPVQQQFFKTNKEYYDARVENIDFSESSTADKINQWVQQSTKNKIQKIVDGPIDAQTIMFLINAIYFKAKWAEQFDPQKTRPDTFYSIDEIPEKCSMMQIKEKFDYYSASEGQIIELPYGNKNFSMIIVLPDSNSSINNLSKTLSKNKWKNWISHFNRKEVKLFLPKFKMEYEINLNETLQSMGMRAAFDPDQSDFSNINEQYGHKLFIDEVLHKSYLEVDEKGTEAAAVTSARMKVTAAYPREKPIVMRVDRPFLFAIRDCETGTLLFLGKIVRLEE